MDLGLERPETLRSLMEIATGEAYTNELGTFGEPHNSRNPGSTMTIPNDDFKEAAARKAMSTAGSVFRDGMPVKRMRLGPTAISRRVTETTRSTFGHQNRKQAYGRRRWMTSTGVLLAAERCSVET